MKNRLQTSRHRIDASVHAAFVPHVQRTFRRERDTVLAAVAESDTPAQAQAAVEAAITDAPWIAAITTLWLSKPVLDLWADVQSGLGIEPVPVSTAAQRQMSRYALAHGTAIAATNRERVAALVGEKDRQYRSSLRRNLQTLYGEMVENRATHVAFVEALQATETIRHEAAVVATSRSTKQHVKVWFTMRDSKVRPTHQRMEGQSRVVKTKRGAPGVFTVGGSLLRFPRDPNGASKEIIGCRCYLEYRTL